MEERGYVEGPSLVILYRSAEGRIERFAELAADLVRQKVDLILTRGTPATLAARRASGSIPIVMAAVADPVESRLAESLTRPGGNVTGLTSATAELVPKRLELLKALVPKMMRVAAYANLANVAAAASWKEIEIAARAMGLEPMLVDVRTPEQIAPAFEEAARQGAQGLMVGIETLTQANRSAIVELAAKHRLPAMYSAREFVEAGGLMSYGVSYPDLYYRAAGSPTASSRAPRRPSCRSSARRSSPSPSTAAPLATSRSSFRRTSCCAPTGRSGRESTDEFVTAAAWRLLCREGWSTKGNPSWKCKWSRSCCCSRLSTRWAAPRCTRPRSSASSTKT